MDLVIIDGAIIFAFLIGRYIGKKEILDMLSFELIKKKNQEDKNKENIEESQD